MNEQFLNQNVPTSSSHSNQNTVNDWHSKIGSLSDCINDEESSWFSLWCCWIVNARTVHMFNLGDSFTETCIFWAALIGSIIAILIFHQIGLLIALGIALYLSFRRANFRTMIRTRLAIPGTFSDDFMLHTFCSCCAVCQESHEAKVMQLQPVDFCFGEPLVNREDAHNEVIEHEDQLSASCLSSFTKYFSSISTTSKFILLLWSGIAIMTIIADLVLNKSANILVLLLVFTQPLLILYFVYWRNRRQVAYLDYVIKTFAYGFWFSTFQSVIFESLLQTIFALVVLIFVPSMKDNPNATEEDQKEMMKNNIVIVIIGLIFMAYVVAAGVEETMKFFVVRCCQFPSPLKDPNTIMVYLMAAALGFATAENIEYVFSQDSSPVSGVTLLEGELLLLLLRILTPVHVICSVLQASMYSKVLMTQAPINTFQILLPAILLHGTFDFVLMTIAAFAFMYDLPGFTFEIISLVLAVIISTSGAVWAYYSFKKVDSEYRNGFTLMNTDETVLPGSNL